MKKLLLLFVSCMITAASFAQSSVAASLVKSCFDGGLSVAKKADVVTQDNDKADLKTGQATEKDAVVAKIIQQSKQSESALAASWEKVEATPDAGLPATIRPEVWTIAPITKAKLSRVKPKKAVEMQLKDYFSKDSSRYKGIENVPMKLIYKDGGLKMTGVYGLADTITVNIDTEAGTISIPPQQVGYSTTYKSAVYIYAIDLTKNVYSTTEPITGTYDENGVIQLGAWGVFLAEGDKKGGVFDVYNHSEWVPSNATLTNTDKDGVATTYASLIEQPYENELVIYNFYGNVKTVTATITSAKTLKISPQYIFTNALYGDFYCYPVDLTTNKVDSKSSITGTGTSNSLLINSWVVGMRSMPTTVATTVAKTEISTSLTIKYPESLTANFTGEGTESSPYLIKTAADINALSQTVADGETYQGKYFRLENDIDMTSSTSKYIPIGSVDAPFNAMFDGNGKTISNLSLDLKGTLYVGLFGYIESEATVKNLTITKGTISGSGNYYGFVAGYSRGVVDGCTVSGNIVSKGSTSGSVVGCSEKAVRNSSFTGNVYGYGCVGGVVGLSHGEVSKCHAEAYVNLNGYLSAADNDAGGVAGELYPLKNTTAYMSDCYFVGTVADTRGFGYTGGVVSMAVGAKVERCFNTGTVHSVNSDSSGSDTASGGIVGISSRSEFTDCYNSGAVIRGGSYASDGAAGVAGYLSVTYQTYPTLMVENASTFTNCYNSGLVSSSAADTHKGMWGRTFIYSAYGNPAPSMFVNSYFDMQVTGLSDEQFGKPTSFFTSGTLPSGFSSDIWTATANQYPLLKTVSDNIAAKLSAASFLLSGTETAVKVKQAFTVNAPNGVSWKLYDGTNFVEETDALKMSGSTVTIKDIYSNEVLTALTTEGYARIYSLAIVPKVFDGEGTEASPYLIKTKDDFIKLDEAVREHKQPHVGDFFAMTNDIDFELADDFSGVSVGGSYPFGGTFDGKGYYIHKLKIHSAAYDDAGKATTDGSYFGAGLFNYCSAASTIKNVNIASDCDFDFFGEAGPVVGYTLGTVESCRNYANVNGVSLYVGGVVGVVGAGGKVSKCYNAGNVLDGNYGAGGIAAYNHGTVELSQNDGNVAADYYNDFKKAGLQDLAGGIVGTNFGNLDRNVNNGMVSSYSVIGGIAGVAAKDDEDISITGNVNNGLVVDLSTTNTRGGLIGRTTGAIAVAENNYFDASLNVNGGVMNANMQGVNGLSSEALTAGTALAGLSASDFDFAASKYPVLAAFKEEPATVALRSIYMKFADGEKRTDMVRTVALSEGENLVWTLAQNTAFNLSGSSVTVTTPTEMVVVSDTLTAVLGGTYTKVFYLSSMPQNLFEGKGTAEAPYLLKSADDVNTLSSFMASSGMEYDGYYFKVVNDIDYAQGVYSPIASGSVNFQGDFDGNGKTISNFVYEDENNKTGANAGFFGNIGGNGVVHDLTLAGKIHGYRYVGGFTSNLYGDLRNCVNKSAISAKSGYVGGLAYKAYQGASIEGCSNEGTVNSVGSNFVGGIVVAMVEGSTIDNCVNKGVVTAKSGNIGGVVNTCAGVITNCHNEAELTQEVNTVGGVVANISGNGQMENCYNVANITGKSSVGGVLAIGADKATVVIKNCYNTGNITGTGTVGGVIGKTGKGYTIEDCYNTGDITAISAANNGGLMGSTSGSEEYPSYVRRCYNMGNVVSGGTKAAGLVGYALSDEVTFEDCYNTGNVTMTATKSPLGTGGLFGALSGKAVRCWNSGDVTSTGYGTGGISGYASGTIDSCFNVGNITAEGNGTTKYGVAGGLWGYGNAQIHNCYNMGNVTAPTLIGGIIGNCFANTNITNSYNAGKLTATAEADAQWANIAIITDAYIESTTFSNNYYDSDVNAGTDYETTTGSVGKTTTEMFDTKPSDAFICTRAAYPTLSVFADNAWANFVAASIAFTGKDDNAQNVTDTFYVGAFSNVSWTSSTNVTLAEDGTAEPIATGEGWVKATASFGEHLLEKTITLNIVKAVSGVGSIAEGMPYVSRTFYDLGGAVVSVPQPGKVYIVTETYEDGSRKTAKVLYTK